MFYNCESLSEAPSLPATTLANNCYNQMFYGCKLLTTAPLLPATSLADYCYSSMFRFSKTGAFNVPYGGMSYNDKTLSEKVKYMFSPKFNDLLLTTVIHNSDFEQFLKQYSFKETDFIFLDPPYDSDFSTYDQNSFDKKEQIRLKNAIASLKAKWMLIIKKTDFISELYKDFFVYEYDKNYTVSFKNRNEKGVKHLLITNYDINEVNG